MSGSVYEEGYFHRHRQHLSRNQCHILVWSCHVALHAWWPFETVAFAPVPFVPEDDEFPSI
jgi:hypothetical protein